MASKRRKDGKQRLRAACTIVKNHNMLNRRDKEIYVPNRNGTKDHESS
jgi:hypothetical protein